MSRILYVPKKFGEASEDIIRQANAICAEYAAQGFDLTLRQLYYQFVSRDIIPNRDKEYKRLGTIINDARLAGRLDWNYIVDRTRELRGVNHYADPQEILNIAARSYREDKWATQPRRVEVWIEKDALIGVIEGICRDVDVDYFSCRGYVSQSEMWQAAQRIGGYVEAGQSVTILHLGDHDPSGIDMTRDISERITKFIQEDFGNNHSIYMDEVDFEMATHCGAADRGEEAFEVKRIALTMEQVTRYSPPPNPAKITDSRARGYIAAYGRESWELDALDPATLAALIADNVEPLRDEELWNEAVDKEAIEQERLATIARDYEDLVA